MNKKKLFPIMFHHFHDGKKFKASQGSITSYHLEKMIKLIGVKNIINAGDYIENTKNQKMKNKQICFTFDDALKCQYKIAYPVLKKYNIKAFWFIYTSIFTKKPSMLEIYREFRNSFFENIDSFYKLFFDQTRHIKFNKVRLNNFINDYSVKYPFYSKNDLKFRFLRDHILKNQYDKIMIKMMKKKKISIFKISKNLFINKKELKKLNDDGQIIGLHSHSHPTNLKSLNKKESINDYKKNIKLLEKITNKKIISMSHPCGNYNQEILNFLHKKKIQVGFASSSKLDKKLTKFKNLVIPRTDHTSIVIK
tara:strand:+ start:1724 stop:2647 length:924 start_codon:yes stop_codon:yes gene_type:complete